jgi:hypothetical protein
LLTIGRCCPRRSAVSEASGLKWCPTERELRNLLDQYTPDLIDKALRLVAYRVAGGYISSYGDKWIRYLYGVLRNMQAA